jgi:hypothetical protein
MSTNRQEKAVQIYVENRGKSVSAAMREAGYSDTTAKNPKNLTESPQWMELLDKYLPDKKLADAHKKLLSAKKIEHMVFPLAMEQKDIRSLLKSVGCTPRKIQHGDSAIHVWFWAPDTAAQAKAVELGYKVKGKLTQKIEHVNPIMALVEFVDGIEDSTDSDTD